MFYILVSFFIWNISKSKKWSNKMRRKKNSTSINWGKTNFRGNWRTSNWRNQITSSNQDRGYSWKWLDDTWFVTWNFESCTLCSKFCQVPGYKMSVHFNINWLKILRKCLYAYTESSFKLYIVPQWIIAQQAV